MNFKQNNSSAYEVEVAQIVNVNFDSKNSLPIVDIINADNNRGQLTLVLKPV